MSNLPIYNKPVTLDDEIKALEREIKLRESNYPKWSSGPNAKMKPEEAAFQIAVMKAVLKRLLAIKAKEGVQTSIF